MDFPKAILAWGNFFLEFWRGFAWISKKQYWWKETIGGNTDGRKLWGNFPRKLERVGVDFPKAILAGGSYGGIFSRNLERVCVDFQKAILAGENYGEIFREIWRGFARISKRQYWWEEAMGGNTDGRKLWGNFPRNFERVGVDFSKAILAGGSSGEIFLEILRGFVWISKKQY